MVKRRNCWWALLVFGCAAAPPPPAARQAPAPPAAVDAAARPAPPPDRPSPAPALAKFHDCGELACKAFPTAADAFDFVLTDAPRVLAIGEAHAQSDGPKSPS